DFSRVDVLFSPDNEDKVFNPGILSHEKSVKIITRFTQEKKLVVSFASWLSEDFDPPFSELLVFKEVPNSMRLLPFSSKNEEKVFKPGIYAFKKFHCCFLSKLSHPGDHRKVQLNELNELRDQAYENSLIYKEKTKRLHDSKIKDRVFNIGDRVLLFNSRLKIFSGKLKSRWSGPFTISHVFPYGTVELSQADGIILERTYQRWLSLISKHSQRPLNSWN
nr:reverse transcriptase domain-containing protein [Tanacetum cinerariifolium]